MGNNEDILNKAHAPSVTIVRIEWCQIDVQSLQLDDESFDVVLARQV